VLDLGLRILAPNPDGYFPLPPGTAKVFYPSEEVTPGVSGVSRVTINSLGCRGPEYAGEQVKLLVLGSSTAACTQLDDEEAWPQLVMRGVNEASGDPRRLWVANAAIDGTDSTHHVAQAKILVPRLPKIDLVLVYCGLNDINRWLNSDSFARLSLDDPATWNEAVARAFKESPVTHAEAGWWKSSPLFRRLHRAGLVIRGKIALARSNDQGIEQDERLRWIQREQEKRRQAAESRVPTAKMDELPAVLEAYGARLRAIADHVRAAGAEPIFMMHSIRGKGGSVAERERMWMGLMQGGAAYATHEDMETLAVALNARMREVAAEKRALLIDLPAALDGKDALYFDMVHLNEKGAREAARAVVDAIAPLVAERAKAGAK